MRELEPTSRTTTSLQGGSWLDELDEALAGSVSPDLRLLGRLVERWERSAASASAARGYRQANCGLASDTFMATPATPTSRDLGPATGRAIARARQALAVLDELDGTLPGQPLRHALERREGWGAAAPARAHQVAFVGRGRVFVADPWRTSDDSLSPILTSLLTETATAGGAELLDLRSSRPPRAAVAVGLGEWTLAEALHLHRRAWTAGGGPWLGVVDTPNLTVLSTCHAAIDGYGHLELARRLLRSRPAFTAPPWTDEALGFAAMRLSPHLRFTFLAYSFGRALQRFFGNEGSHTPTFQVPVAPGDGDDAARARRRVRHALITVAHPGGRAESLEEFSGRLRVVVARERSSGGPLTRLANAVAASPLPSWLQQRQLTTRRRPRRALPAISLLAGRGRLSYLRATTGESVPGPLFAASQPGLLPTARDRRGSLVLTVVDHEDSCTASVLGVGRASGTGAADFLATWSQILTEVARQGRGR